MRRLGDYGEERLSEMLDQVGTSSRWKVRRLLRSPEGPGLQCDDAAFKLNAYRVLKSSYFIWRGSRVKPRSPLRLSMSNLLRTFTRLEFFKELATQRSSR